MEEKTQILLLYWDQIRRHREGDLAQRCMYFNRKTIQRLNKAFSKSMAVININSYIITLQCNF